MQNDYASVPDDLKILPHWIIHKEKVPVNPVTKEKDDYTNRDICVTFDEAVEASDGFDGIGFCFFNTGLVGIDIDTCRDPKTGEISEEASKIIKFLNSYTEISPSGYGVHIYVFSDIQTLPFHKRPMKDNGIERKIFNKKTGQYEYKKPEIEFYKEKRYFTVTGNILDDYANIKKMRTKKLQKIFDYFSNNNKGEKKIAEKSYENEPNKNYRLEESRILEIMFASSKGEELKGLYEGDTSKYDNDESRADLALCNELAFYCQKDIAMMDKLFRQSGLMRDKWDEFRGKVTYGEMTLKKAIDDCTDLYDPNHYRKTEKRVLSVNEYDKLRWEIPKPLGDIELPEFPVSYLPRTIMQYVMAVSESMQSNIDMAASASLPIIGQCVQKKFMVKGKEGWLQHLNLYVAIVANSAEKKSPTIKEMMKYVYQYEQKIKIERDKAIKQNKIEKDTLENEVDILKRHTARKPDSKYELFEKQEELSNFIELKPIQYTVDDVTPEALVEIMEQNQEKIALISSEGGIFEIMNGKYSGSVNTSHFLKAHSNDKISVNRKHGQKKEITLLEPALTMLLCFQPKVLEDVFSNDIFQGQGLTARFLYSIPKLNRGYCKFDTIPISKEVSKKYEELCIELMDIPIPDIPTIIDLSSEARELFKVSYENKHKLFSVNENLNDWIGKLHGHILRIAGILHVAHNKSRAGSILISGKTMEAAIKIGDYFLEHAKYAYGLYDINSELGRAKYILEGLRKQNKNVLTKYDIHRLCRRFKGVDKMIPSLKLLIDNGYLQEVTEERLGDTKGRNPDNRYALNPLFFTNVNG